MRRSLRDVSEAAVRRLRLMCLLATTPDGMTAHEVARALGVDPREVKGDLLRLTAALSALSEDDDGRVFVDPCDLAAQLVWLGLRL